MGRLLPVITRLQASLRVHKNIGRSGRHGCPTPHAGSPSGGYRPRTPRIGWVKQHDTVETGTKPCCQFPVLAPEFMDDSRTGSGQQRGNDHANVPAAARGSKDQDVLRPSCRSARTFPASSHPGERLGKNTCPVQARSCRCRPMLHSAWAKRLNQQFPDRLCPVHKSACSGPFFHPDNTGRIARSNRPWNHKHY